MLYGKDNHVVWVSIDGGLYGGEEDFLGKRRELCESLEYKGMGSQVLATGYCTAYETSELPHFSKWVDRRSSKFTALVVVSNCLGAKTAEVSDFDYRNMGRAKTLGIPVIFTDTDNNAFVLADDIVSRGGYVSFNGTNIRNFNDVQSLKPSAVAAAMPMTQAINPAPAEKPSWAEKPLWAESPAPVAEVSQKWKDMPVDVIRPSKRMLL